jgi:uncharacterized cupin superfamily protein
MTQANLFAADFAYDDEDPDGYRAGVANVGMAAGGQAITVKAYEIPPGQSSCPYHYEYEEEWLLVLQGSLILRTPDGERALARGDLVCFPPGPAGAHRVHNAGADAARTLMLSSSREPAVAVYPDSDKIGVWPGNDADTVMLKRRDGSVDYWDGEQTRAEHGDP